MTGTRLARWMVGRAAALGAHEALVGDLLEEIVAGRSALWVWDQLAGWGAAALLSEARRRLRLTQPLVSVLVGIVLLGCLQVAPLGSVLETWMTCYLAAGTASLFAHVMARTAGSRTLGIPGADRT